MEKFSLASTSSPASTRRANLRSRLRRPPRHDSKLPGVVTNLGLSHLKRNFPSGNVDGACSVNEDAGTRGGLNLNINMAEMPVSAWFCRLIRNDVRASQFVLDLLVEGSDFVHLLRKNHASPGSGREIFNS